MNGSFSSTFRSSIVFALVLGWVIAGVAQIAVATITHGSTQTAGGPSKTLNLTSVVVTGPNPVLIVKIAYRDNAGGEVTSVVWDSAGVNETLTQLGSESRVNNVNSQMWYKANLTAKTATVTITTTNTVRMVGAASVYTGVNQTNPFRIAANATSTGIDATPTVDVVALNGEMVVDSLAQVSAGPDTATASQTERHNVAQTGGGKDVRGASQEVASTGATETIGWTMNSSDRWAIIAGALQESPTTYEQSAYRIFENANSTQVGNNPLATQDTAATLSTSGDAFRLRSLLHIGGAELAINGLNFKLQFATKSGTCDTSFTGETYADVTAVTAIAYNNNTTPIDGTALTASSTDPTHSADIIVNQDYEELNNFTNSEAAIPAGQDGKWDFSLIDNLAPANTSYCFRIVQSDSTLLDTYTTIPEVTTAASSSNPTISSARNRVFVVGQTPARIPKITVTDNATPTITAANNLRIAIATSSVTMKWRVAITTATFGGTASGKVSNPISYEGNASVLVVPVVTDFAGGDTLEISGLRFRNFTAVNAAISALQIFKDGPTDFTSDANDDKTVTITGSMALAPHNAGGVTDEFKGGGSPKNITSGEMLTFKLTPTADENVTVDTLVINLLRIAGFITADVTNAKLVIDYDADGIVDAGETEVGGVGVVSISGEKGTITFSTAFTATTTRNYILTADVAGIVFGDRIRFSLRSNRNSIAASGAVSLGIIRASGDYVRARHWKVSAISGGGGTGGDSGLGSGTGSGGSTGGGETIGNDPGFEAPTANASVGSYTQWTTPGNVNSSDGTYATLIAVGANDWHDFNFTVPSGNTVNGIQVKIEASASTAAGTIDAELSS